MSFRPNPKYASQNAKLGAWTSCDRCGILDNQSNMQFQYDFLGGSVPQNTGYLVCPRCVDGLRWQNSLLIIPPDPPPLFNTRPENYTVDETDWLTTQDDEIIDTQSGEEFITSIPNPAQTGDTSSLVTSMQYPGGSLTGLYLDLFDGDPTDGGVSVLAAITGSSTRTDISGDMEANVNNIAVNPETILVAASSASQTNISFAALYSAASGGTLLTSAALSVVGQTIGDGTRVEFAALGLTIDLS